jgi:pimeloyl-ACP methyl ester carboxylesterase
MRASTVAVAVALLICARCGGADRVTSPVASAPPGARAPAAEVSEGTVRSADGVRIRYIESGCGPVAVVLVHCLGCSSREWEGTIAHLSQRTRVVALDLAGHGQSGSQRRAWTILSFAQDVRAVVDGLGLKKIVLVGHSLGGPVIVEAALAMQDSVIGVVPVETLKGPSQPMSVEQRARLLAPLRANFRGETEKFVRSLFPADADPSLVDGVAAAQIANDPEVMIPALDEALAWPEAQRLALLSVPIVAVQGDLIPTSVDENRKVAPQYNSVFVSGTGHWPMLERPQAFFDALDDALRAVGVPVSRSTPTCSRTR